MPATSVDTQSRQELLIKCSVFSFQESDFGQKWFFQGTLDEWRQALATSQLRHSTKRCFLISGWPNEGVVQRLLHMESSSIKASNPWFCMKSLISHSVSYRQASSIMTSNLKIRPNNHSGILSYIQSAGGSTKHAREFDPCLLTKWPDITRFRSWYIILRQALTQKPVTGRSFAWWLYYWSMSGIKNTILLLLFRRRKI